MTDEKIAYEIKTVDKKQIPITTHTTRAKIGEPQGTDKEFIPRVRSRSRKAPHFKKCKVKGNARITEFLEEK